MVRRPWRLRAFFFLIGLGSVLFLARSWWLPWVAYPLIHDEGPAKADAVVMLAGDVYGLRMEKAASLVRDGYAPYVLVSGPELFDIHECDLAIAHAVRKGFPEQWFVPLPNSAHSTKEEAGLVLAELRRRGAHRFLLVTSDYHTRRAGRIYRAAISATGGDLEMRVVAAGDRYFRAESWWHERQAQKTVLEEWLKTVAGAMGM